MRVWPSETKMRPAVQETIQAVTPDRSQPVYVPSQVSLRDYPSEGTQQPSTSVVVVSNSEFVLNNTVEGSNSTDVAVREDAALNAVSSDLRDATFWSDESLTRCQAPDTFVLPDHSPLVGKLSDGSSVVLLGDQLRNEEAKFVGNLRPPGRRAVLQAGLALDKELRLSAYVNPRSARPPVRRCPHGQKTSGSGRSQADSGGGGSYQGSVVTGFGGSSFGSRLGYSGGGDKDDEDDDDDPWKQRPVKLTSSHYTDAEFPMVYEAEQSAVQGRRFPLQPNSVEGPASAIVPFISDPGHVATTHDLGLQAVPPQWSHAGHLPWPGQALASATPPPTQHPFPADSCPEALAFPQHSVDMDIGSPPPTQIASSVDGCLGPSTTPQGTSPNQPLTVATRIVAGKRVYEIAVNRSLPQQAQVEALQYLSGCNDLYLQLVSCVEQPCHLKVAVEARAKLCESTFDRVEGKLVFSMPNGVRLEDWAIARPSIDLCERGYVLLQVVNTLAAIHMLGHRDCLSLSGFFFAWVTPEMQVYLLVDITRLFSNLQTHAAGYGDCNLRKILRKEDVKKVKTFYQDMIGQHIDHNNEWFSLDPFREFSPAVLQMFKDFKSLLADQSCWSKMAELAVTLGEKSMCKLEVEGSRALSLVSVSCLEQEPMPSALGPLNRLVRKDVSPFWVARWTHSGELVRPSDQAVAYRPMQLELIPPPSDGIDVSALYIFATD